MQPRLTYTIPEVAQLLGISRSTAYECVRRGEIPALSLGRRKVIPRAALDALLTTEAASTAGASSDDASTGPAYW